MKTPLPPPKYNLEEVQAHFIQWRETRPGRHTRIPDELWEEAVSLSGHYPISHICRALRLSSQSFYEKYNGVRQRPARKSSESAAFNLIPMELVPDSQPGVRVSDVILERPDGLRMRVTSGNGFEFSQLISQLMEGFHASGQSSK